MLTFFEFCHHYFKDHRRVDKIDDHIEVADLARVLCLKIGLLVPAILGQSITVSTLNSKVLNRPLTILMVNDGKNLVKADCERPPV